MGQLPNFLIVGAAKSGTTSLYQYLRQHPEVFMPYLKEPTFLAGPETAGRIDTLDEYGELFSRVQREKAIGEASTIYLPDPRAPQKIMNLLGKDTKIIIVLRNPIDMIYSLWGHRRREGGEKSHFMEAVMKGKSRYKERNIERIFSVAGRLAVRRPYPYVYQAQYADQVDRYKKVFEKVEVYIFEELFNDIIEGFNDLCSFLEVDDSFQPSFEKYNRAGEARSKLLRSLINNTYFIKQPLKVLLPSSVRIKIKSLVRYLNTQPNPLPPLSMHDRRQLAKVFEQDVNRLETLLDRSLSNIWTDFA